MSKMKEAKLREEFDFNPHVFDLLLIEEGELARSLEYVNLVDPVADSNVELRLYENGMILSTKHGQDEDYTDLWESLYDVVTKTSWFSEQSQHL